MLLPRGLDLPFYGEELPITMPTKSLYAMLLPRSLDTPLYNSMTTGCDVLWSGVPLVSLAGEKMVSCLA